MSYVQTPGEAVTDGIHSFNRAARTAQEIDWLIIFIGRGLSQRRAESLASGPDVVRRLRRALAAQHAA